MMPTIVYFSSVSQNTHRFVTRVNERTGGTLLRIPLRRNDPQLTVTEPYLLVTPTYGHGTPRGAVPKQVVAFLNNPGNRLLCQGVISGGNTNFGRGYCLAGRIIAEKLTSDRGVTIPDLYQFEIFGTPTDVQAVAEIATQTLKEKTLT